VAEARAGRIHCRRGVAVLIGHDDRTLGRPHEPNVGRAFAEYEGPVRAHRLPRYSNGPAGHSDNRKESTAARTRRR